MHLIARKLIDKAKSGDLTAAKLCLAWMLGKPGEPINPDKPSDDADAEDTIAVPVLPRPWGVSELPADSDVARLLEEVRNDPDLIIADAFVAACCIRDARAKTPVAALYAAYQEWCTKMGHHAVDEEDFTFLLDCEMEHPRRGGPVCVGLRLKY